MILHNVKIRFWCNECKIYKRFLYVWVSDDTLKDKKRIVNKECPVCKKEMKIVSINGEIGYMEGYNHGL